MIHLRASMFSTVLISALLISPTLSLAKTLIVNFKDSQDLSVLRDAGTTRADKLTTLRSNSAISQRSFMKFFADSIREAEEIWLTNSLIVHVDDVQADSVTQKMFRFPSVHSIEENSPVFLPKLHKGRNQSQTEKPQHANGVRHIGAPKIWQEYAFKGEGQLIGVIDTGIDPNHPDLIGRTVAFRDFVQGLTEPYDDNGHGTHCGGSIAGGASTGTAIGVAPEAKLIVAKALSGAGSGYAENLLKALQWMADPDGNPQTDDCPAAVSNSWGGQTQTYYLNAVRRLLELDIVPVFATGNSGPGPRTVLVPAGFKESLAVGALSVRDDIARFSSRGPIFWDNGPLIKPDVAGPGVDIYSAKAGGGYVSYSGTSMACPHVAALVALIRQAKPNLSAGAVRWLIESTCLDLGSSGKDNTFGFGRVNGFEAVQQSQQQLSLKGKVVDSETGLPLAAELFLDDALLAQQVYLPSGSFEFYGAPGVHEVKAKKFGYGEVILAVEPGQELRIEMSKLPHGKLQLSIVEDGSLAPVGAKVKVLDTPLPSEMAETGALELELPLGRYEVLVTAVGWKSTYGSVEITADCAQAEIVLTKVPPLLLVDDDDGARYEKFFKEALPSKLEFDRIEPHRFGQLTFEDLLAYEKVIWWTGDIYRAPITGKDEEAIERYLTSGGHIILSGQHLAESLKFSPFLRKALAGRCASTSVKSRNVKGLSLNLTIEGGDGANNQKGPDRLNAFNTGREILHYKPIGGAAAVSACELGGFSVTLGFGLEAVSKKRDRQKLMAKLLGLLPTSKAQQEARLKLLKDKRLRKAFAQSLDDLSPEVVTQIR